MIRKILRSLSVACMTLFFMLIMVGSVYAADTAPYAEFVNEPKVQPSPLTIKKTVQADPPGIEIPDEEFHFVLKINDEFYANKAFMVSTYTGEGIGGAVTGATTDENGGFTLLNNQTAIFEDVANGMATGVSYTITEELPEDSPFECTAPPGNGTVSGVIEEGGTSISFVNTYHQPVPKEYGELTILNSFHLLESHLTPSRCRVALFECRFSESICHIIRSAGPCTCNFEAKGGSKWEMITIL